MTPPAEVYHKIPEFKTVRKRLPLLHETWSNKSKPKLGLDKKARSKSVSVEKQQQQQLQEQHETAMHEANTKSIQAISTKIEELTEIKKKMEKLDAISAKASLKHLDVSNKQLKAELLKELNKKSDYNVYMNGFPFVQSQVEMLQSRLDKKLTKDKR